MFLTTSAMLFLCAMVEDARLFPGMERAVDPRTDCKSIISGRSRLAEHTICPTCDCYALPTTVVRRKWFWGAT